ncbi:uncharacterized protein LOC144163835 [Haemaphysalis longicornis]
MGVRQQTTSCYHPQPNVTERRNRDVKLLLRAYARTHRDWDEHLNAISFALRTRENHSTGFTPAFLTFERELPTPTDTVLAKRADDEAARMAMADYLRRLRFRLANAIEAANRNRKKRALVVGRRDLLLEIRRGGRRDSYNVN